MHLWLQFCIVWTVTGISHRLERQLQHRIGGLHPTEELSSVNIFLDNVTITPSTFTSTSQNLAKTTFMNYQVTWSHFPENQKESLEYSTIGSTIGNHVLRDAAFMETNITLSEQFYQDEKEARDIGQNKSWHECPTLHTSSLVQEGFQLAVARGLHHCAEFWCSHVVSTEVRRHLDGVYHVVQLGHVTEEEHVCLLNLTRMVVLHHSWPMCSSDFICATNHSRFEMSASDCMPILCRTAETLALIFMIAVSTAIVSMSIIIMVVIVLCPEFQKPKYYLRFSLAATDFFIGIIVCAHAAYNQWVGLTEVPLDRFSHYSNLKAGQLFRHVPNCLWGVSDMLTQVSGFFVSSNIIVSLYTLSLMSLDRYLLLTRTHYRALVTSGRVTAALVMAWCCGLVVPSLHFVYRPHRQHDMCVNYDTSFLDVHIINNESKIASADYKVYLRHALPLAVTVLVVGLPVVALLIFSFRTLRKYKSYTRDRSVRQVKSALQLTQNQCNLSRQASASSLGTMVNLAAFSPPKADNSRTGKFKSHFFKAHPPAYKLKRTFNNKRKEPDKESSGARPQSATISDESSPSLAGDAVRQNLVRSSSGSPASDGEDENYKKIRQPGTHGHSSSQKSSFTCPIAQGQESVEGARGLPQPVHRQRPATHVAATIRKITSGVAAGRGNNTLGERVTVRERDREITCTVLVNIMVFVIACFPLLAVGGWMMFLYFTKQDTINNRPPLKQLLFVAPWMMALNSLWNAVLHLAYNHKFRAAAKHLICVPFRKVFSLFCKRQDRDVE